MKWEIETESKKLLTIIANHVIISTAGRPTMTYLGGRSLTRGGGGSPKEQNGLEGGSEAYRKVCFIHVEVLRQHVNWNNKEPT